MTETDRLSHKDICMHYFNDFKIETWSENGRNSAPDTVVKGCICLCEQKIKWVGTTAGYENLFRHVQAKHSNYVNEVPMLKECKAKNMTQKYMSDFISQPKAINAFAWLKLIIFCNLPFSMCENSLFRESVKLKDISRNTLTKYLRQTMDQHTKELSSIMPDKFGVMFDGWSIGTQHYLGVFAIWDSHMIMIAISPLGNEENFRAVDHIEHLKYILDCYGKSVANVCFLSLDNENTNRSISNRINIPMIGCAAHRLNLAMDKWIESIPEIEKVHDLMKKLRTLKVAGWLRKRTAMAAEDYNKTRWLSTYKMLQKYFRLEPIFRDEPHEEIADLQLSSREHSKLSRLFNGIMRDLHSVQVSIQSNDMKFNEVRLLFDELIEDHGADIPSLEKYLSEDSAFVNDPHFESGILKIMNGRNDLTPAQVDAVKCFEIEGAEPQNDVADDGNMTYAERVLKKRKMNLETGMTSNYQRIDWIPATNSVVERAFSRGGIVLSDLRQRMTPLHFECVMMLYLNKKHWNIATVTAAIAVASDDEVEQLDEED